MKRFYILSCLLLCLTGISNAYDVPAFGQQFRDWVNNQARSDSKSLCDADYPSRLQNTFTVAYDILDIEAYNMDSVLNMVYQHFVAAEAGSAQKDSLRQAVERAHDTRLYYIFLLNMEGKINQLRALKRELDSIGTRRYFMDYGLPHVGRENVMESYVELGNKFKETFNQKYDNYFEISINTSGQTNIQFDNDMTPYYLSLGGQIIGAAICGPVCAVVGGIVGGIIGFVYSWFSKKSKEEEAREEIQRQKEILMAAMDDLPGKLLNGEEMYAIYKTNVGSSRVDLQACKLEYSIVSPK